MSAVQMLLLTLGLWRAPAAPVVVEIRVVVVQVQHVQSCPTPDHWPCGVSPGQGEGPEKYK